MTASGEDVAVALALGSNLGDRVEHLAFGVDRLRALIRGVRASSVVESPPWGGAAQPDYLNLVVIGETGLAPRALLDRLLGIERAAGRLRTQPGAPRTLDVDLILYGDRVLRAPGLTVPHPRWHVRGFVALPLLELLPDGRDPETGRTLAERVAPAARAMPLRRLGPLEGLRAPADATTVGRLPGA